MKLFTDARRASSPLRRAMVSVTDEEDAAADREVRDVDVDDGDDGDDEAAVDAVDDPGGVVHFLLSFGAAGREALLHHPGEHGYADREDGEKERPAARTAARRGARPRDIPRAASTSARRPAGGP